jgi:hypothetical protein
VKSDWPQERLIKHPRGILIAENDWNGQDYRVLTPQKKGSGTALELEVFEIMW